MKSLLDALLRMGLVISDARDLKKDEQLRKRCKRYGITAVILAAVTIPFALLAGLCLQWLHGEAAILFIFIIVLLVASFAAVLMFMLYALFYWIIQLYVNRGVTTWITFVLMLGCFAAAVILSLQVLGVPLF